MRLRLVRPPNPEACTVDFSLSGSRATKSGFDAAWSRVYGPSVWAVGHGTTRANAKELGLDLQGAPLTTARLLQGDPMRPCVLSHGTNDLSLQWQPFIR